MIARHRVGCCSKAIDAIDDVLLRIHGVDVRKALDPLDPDDFDVLVQRFADAMNEAAAGQEAAAIRAALATLDVDWATMNAAGRDAILESIRESMGSATERIMPGLAEQFEIVGNATMEGARESAIRRFGFDIQTSLSLRDRDAERFIRGSYSNMVTNAYGERVDALATTARDIVADGLELGLGRDEIAERLAAAMGDRLVRGASYFQVVAGAFMNTARTASQLNAYADAGVEQYAFEAVMDEATTDQCRFYHGQVFSVAAGVEAMNAQMRTTSMEELENANPWIRVGTTESGEKSMYFVRDGERVEVARIEQSGVGTQGAGTYSNAMTSTQLSANGIPYPPLHGNCRSTIVPAGVGF